MRQQLLSWLILVVMPYLILIAGFLAVTGRGKRDFAGKTFKLGVEACILGVGLAVALVGSQETPEAWQIATLVIVFGFVLIAIYGQLYESHVRRTRRARLSIVFSTLVFGANATTHASVYKPGSVFPPLWLGVAAWLVPCLISIWFVHDNKAPETANANPPAPATS